MKNKIQDYHISKGADSHFYILNDGDFFVQNLSTDLDKAISKAKKITGKDVPVDIWLRTRQSVFHYEEKPKQHNAHIIAHQSYLDSLIDEKHRAECQARDYLGSVGDEYEKQLELIKEFTFEGAYGITWCLKFKDINDWRYIYFGTSKEIDNFKKIGDKCLVRFEIKKQDIDKYLDNDSRYPYKINHITKIKVLHKILDNNSGIVNVSDDALINAN
jgi:hypothetical protein